MPSGFTAEFENREPSFEEFVWRCARGMGVFIHMRDDSMDAPLRLPTEEDFSGYHEESLERAAKNLKKYSNMALDTAKVLMNKQYDEMIADTKKAIKEKSALKKRYENMLSKVRGWTPPTSEHKNFKKFMIEQLEQSMEWDCNVKYYVERLEAPRQTAREWLNDMVTQAQYDIEYHTKHIAEDRERNKERVEWVQALQNSVPIPPKMKA